MSEKENVLFQQTFESGKLSLMIKLKGLVDKKGMKSSDDGFYDNRCEFILELSTLEGEKKPLYLLTRITAFIDAMPISFKRLFISLKPYFVMLYLEHKDSNRDFLIEILDELIVLTNIAIREDKKINDHQNFRPFPM